MNYWWVFRGFLAGGIALFAWYHTDSGTEEYGTAGPCEYEDIQLGTCHPD